MPGVPLRMDRLSCSPIHHPSPPHSTEGRSSPQELEVGPRSGPYLPSVRNQGMTQTEKKIPPHTPSKKREYFNQTPKKKKKTHRKQKIK